MPRYWVSLYRPADYDPAIAEDDALRADIGTLNDEMVAAGVRVFVGGLMPAETARSLRPQPDGGIRTSAGPHVAAGEQIGGFWVLDVADLEDALAWGRKAAKACRAPVEVRPFH